jgi:hypothetical protein
MGSLRIAVPTVGDRSIRLIGLAFNLFTKLDTRPCKSPRSLYFRLCPSPARAIVLSNPVYCGVELRHTTLAGLHPSGYGFENCTQL